MGLEQQEKKIVMEIKKMAKEGQMNSVKVMAKSLVRNRHAVTKMYGLKSQLQAVSLRMAVRGEIWVLGFIGTLSELIAPTLTILFTCRH